MSELLGDLQDEVAVSRWAFTLPADERDRLLLATASVLAAEDLQARPRATALLDALLPALARDADPSVRGELARRLANAPWAPGELLTELAFDSETEAQALLAGAPALPEAAQLRLSIESGPDVTDALARRRNLSSAVLQALLEAARSRPALRDPLSRRPDLPREAAAQLHAIAGPDLARTLEARFGAFEDQPPASAADTEARLIDKLDRAGRLTPSYAVGALRRGRTGVFRQAAARLADVPTAAVADALEDGPVELALLCAAAGVDRAAFATVLAQARAARGLPPDVAVPPEARAAFERPPEEAARLLRHSAERRAARWAAPGAEPKA